MAFDPPVPSADDWIRDPLGSLGRLVQVMNYRLDQWNAMGRDIPTLRTRIAGYATSLQGLPANAARQSLQDQLTATQRQLDEFVSKRNSLGGKVVDAISQLRAELTRLKQPAQVTGVALAPVVAPLVIVVVGVAIYGITQLVRDWLAIVAQDRSLGTRIIQYAQSQKLTPEQTAALTRTMSSLPKTEGSKDLFGEIEAILPWAVGLAALFFFGPTLRGLIGSRRSA